MPERSPSPVVLVVGGAGSFGARLVEGLVATTSLKVVVAGRDPARAEAIVQRHPPGRVEALRLDASSVGPEDLIASGAGLVVDAAGPFQNADPHLARTAIAAGLSIVDLADARDFVAAYSKRLDASARAAGVVALTGASSTPALSNAVLDAITAGWGRVEAVSIAIVPGNRAPRGLSVMRAILSYAGRPVRVWRAGAWTSLPGWGELGRIAVPRLGRRWVALCETPDLDIVPARFPEAQTVLFRAGLELPILHLGLWLASLPVRVGIIASLEPLAKPFLAIADLFGSFGSDRGGMLVEALGRDSEDRPVRASWSLVAKAGDGPFVPTLPALTVIRRFYDPDTEAIAPGARPCTGLLPLAEIEAEMVRYRIRTRREQDHPEPLFTRALGTSFAGMPAPIRALHGRLGPGCFSGYARVERGGGWLVKLGAGVFGLPEAAGSCPVRVVIDPRVHGSRPGEVWTRRFAERAFSSTMSLSPGEPGQGRMRERFGPFSLDLTVTAHDQGLDMTVTGWQIGPVPLPRFLRPTTCAIERIDDRGRFLFDVSLFLPLLGRLVRYTGWLVPEDETLQR